MAKKNTINKIAAFSILIVFIMFLGMSAVSAEMLKFAVTSNGQTATAAVGSEAARGSFFLIFDGDGKFVEAISNPHQKARSGASSLVVNFLAQQGINVMICQDFGEKMIDALKARGIAHFQSKGGADDVVKKYLKQK